MSLFGWLETKAEGKVIQGDVNDALKENPNMAKWLMTNKGPIAGISAFIGACLQLCGDPSCAKASVFFGLLTLALIHAGVYPSDQEARTAGLVEQLRPHLPAIQAAVPDAHAILSVLVGTVKKAGIVLLAFALLGGSAWAAQQWGSNGDQTATTTATNFSIPFPATTIVVCNDDAANNLWARVDGGTASSAGTDNISWLIKKGECHVFGLGIGAGWFGISTTRTLSVISASTTVFRAQAIGPNP